MIHPWGPTQEGEVATTTSSFTLGDLVFHRGAASGVRRGIVSAIESHLKWDEMKEHDTTEVIVAGANGHFAKPGDSGSLVFNKRGAAVGMIMGGPNRSKTKWSGKGAAYMTPISTLFDDIERETGYVVSLPNIN